MIQRRRGLLAILVTGSLIAAACGGSDGDTEPADEPAATEAPDDTGNEPESTDGDAGDAGDTGDTGDASGDEAPDTTAAPLEDDEQLTSVGEGGDLAALGDPVAGGEITWGLTNDGTGFDTTNAIAPGSIRVITAMVDGLVGLDVNADWAPNLAESLTPNEDFTSWTITMRPGLVFHDGEPVDAAAVAANIEAQKASPTVGFGLANVESITPIDDLSVEVKMLSPWATFPFSLVGQFGWMVSPSTIGTNETFVSTGPFMLESWTPGDGARVVRNPNYWRADEGLPYLDAINFKFLVDATVKRQAFEAGDVEGYVSPDDEDIVDFLEDDAVDVWIGTAGANEYLWLLNTTRAPFDDIRVRRAMAHALDKEFIIENFRSGLTVPANGPLNPSDKWYSPNDYPQFDPAAAQALVDEYEAEVGPIEFELSIEPNASVIEVAEVMMSFLADVGIDGTIKQIGQGQSAITAIQDDFQAFSWFQFGSPDPDGSYTFFHSTGGLLNWSNLVSEKIDEGLALGRQNADEETRRAGYAMFLEALGEEVPMLWIDHLNGVEAAVTIPELNGIGTPGRLRDGSPSLAMTDGSFFAWPLVWLEQ
jgi:peptide/nickel transport system substrate-binding protein